MAGKGDRIQCMPLLKCPLPPTAFPLLSHPPPHPDSTPLPVLLLPLIYLLWQAEGELTTCMRRFWASCWHPGSSIQHTATTQLTALLQQWLATESALAADLS